MHGINGGREAGISSVHGMISALKILHVLKEEML
jgi:hypothetical protein